jgi:hypothetical protein
MHTRAATTYPFRADLASRYAQVLPRMALEQSENWKETCGG